MIARVATAAPFRPPARGGRTLAAGLLTALLLALAACGGGGSDGGGADAGTLSPPVDGGGATPKADPQAAALEQALASGDAAQVTLATVMAAAKAQLAEQTASHASARQALFGLGGGSPVNGITWNPTHDSVTFTLQDGARNHVMLASNWRYKGSTAGSHAALAVVGRAPQTGARYAAFGGNPLGVAGNAAMDQFMRNTLAWLTGRSDLANLKIVTAHLPGTATYWFPHEPKVRTWLAAQVPGVTINGLPADQAGADDGCDGARLDACLQGADLLVIGRQQGPNIGNSSTPDAYPAGVDGAAVMQAVLAAQARGTPVLYLHHYRDAGDLATRMLAYLGLGITNNYWANEGLNAFDAADLPAAPPEALALQALLDRLDQGRFSTTWSGCVADLGKTECERTSGFAGDAALSDEFADTAKALRTRLRSLDAQALPLFATPGYAQEKLLVLLGDKYRESVSYPMDKVTAGADFFRAYFSDLAAYINRPHTTVARNLGNFSGTLPADTPTVSRQVSVDAPPLRRLEHMTGLYVMPGRSVTIAREDTSAANVTVGLNLLRDSTRLYNTNGYARPTMLASPRVALKSGQPLTITSPFGGPLILFIEPVSGAASLPVVQVQVDGATTHPLLRDPADPAQVAAFRAELDSTPTHWVSVRTDFLTVHSTLAHFRQSVADQGGVDNLVAAIVKYMVKSNYELAGFSSATAGAFNLSPEAAAFCQSAGWDCTGAQHRRDKMQHFISDVVATCGAGCSGNPIDSNSPVEPAGSLENHEIGHNLQPERLRIYGDLSDEVSNNIFPVHTQTLFNQVTTGTRKSYHRGSAKNAFDLIKASLATADPAAHMKSRIWTDTAYAANGAMRLSFYRQLVEYARHYNPALGDGWALYTLMYLLDRNVDAAAQDWPAAAAALGFGTYAAPPASIGGNDFMLIAASRIVGRDMRAVFEMWGVDTSAAAQGQVAAYALPTADRLLFPMADMTQSGSGIGAPVRLAPDASYPAGY